jgi:hypothetical protein
MDFMSDRKAGDFYIVTQQVVETQQPWGYYVRVCIAHYTDYGKTLIGTYCHDLTREGVVTAVIETDNYSSLQVYPNPTTGELKVENEELRVKKIEISDLMGRTIKVSPCVCPTKITIDISHLPVGMYFVRIQTETGTITRKIVKQ